MTNKNILCVGNINLDELLYLEDELKEERSVTVDSVISAGGGATNTAMILSNNDNVGNVYLAGSVGTDDVGDEVIDSLHENDIELALDRKENGGTTYIRAIITEDKNPQYMNEGKELMDFSDTDVHQDIWDDIDHVHITSFEKTMAEKFALRAKEENKTLSFNPTQGYFEESFEGVIDKSDLIQMNEQEYETFRERYGDVRNVVQENNVDIVITHGKEGCKYYSIEGVAQHKGYYVDDVVDTVGAGDSFMAGLISAWINNETLGDSLKVANAHGSLSVQTKGAPESISEEEIQKLIHN